LLSRILGCYFLGIEVSKIRDGILQTQEKYARDVLQRVNMMDCKPVATPLSTSEKLHMKVIFLDQEMLQHIEV